MKGTVQVKQPMIGLYNLPVVLVTCLDKDNPPNIIPLGWAGGVCSDPPLVALGIRPRRYSYNLIKKSGEFVINIPCVDIARKVDACGFCSGRDTDKFRRFNLTPVAASIVSPPLIKECPVNLECKLRHFLSLGSHCLFIGEIVAVQADQEFILADGEIDYSRLKPLYLRHDDYCGPSEPVGFYGFSRFKEKVVNKVF